MSYPPFNEGSALSPFGIKALRGMSSLVSEYFSNDPNVKRAYPWPRNSLFVISIFITVELHCTDTKICGCGETTLTFVHEYIKEIVVYALDKSGDRRTQKGKIYFNFLDDVDILVISKTVIIKTNYERRSNEGRHL